MQDAAKDAAGQLRSQQNDFATHKKSINSSIKNLRSAQFKLTSWRYAMKLVMCVCSLFYILIPAHIPLR
jgi:hypothetical protein